MIYSIINSRLCSYSKLLPTFSELSFVSQQHDSFLKYAKYLRRHASSLVISQHSNNWEKIGVLSPERSTSVLNMYIVHGGRKVPKYVNDPKENSLFRWLSVFE